MRCASIVNFATLLISLWSYLSCQALQALDSVHHASYRPQTGSFSDLHTLSSVVPYLFRLCVLLCFNLFDYPLSCLDQLVLVYFGGEINETPDK